MGKLKARDLAMEGGGAVMILRWAITGGRLAILLVLFVRPCLVSCGQDKSTSGRAPDSQGESRPAPSQNAAPVDDETIEIPLDQAWGSTGSRGKGSLRSLEPEYFIYRNTPEKIAKYGTPEGSKELHRLALKSLTYHIELAMGDKKGQPGPGFVVVGTGKEALQGVYDVIVKGATPQNKFREGTELSLVFFTHPAGPAAYVENAKRKGNTIELEYVLILHGRPHLSWRLAMIPIGNFSPGEYHVRFNRAPIEESKLGAAKESLAIGFPPASEGSERDIICRPFDFVVAEVPLVKSKD